jgi:hypothetical protein
VQARNLYMTCTVYRAHQLRHLRQLVMPICLPAKEPKVDIMKPYKEGIQP